MEAIHIIEKAIAYIEAHLDEDIGLSDVARDAGYSYYHMTRLFNSVLGEPVGSYITKRRLYNASQKLLYSQKKVMEIALESGFDSAEAFSRAFKSQYRSSPYYFRKNGINSIFKTKRELRQEEVRHIATNLTLIPDIIEMEDIEIAGIRGMTSLSDNRIAGYWEEFRELRKNIAFPAAGYCLCETQNGVYDEAGNFDFSVIVATPASSFRTIPNCLIKKTLKKGKYAVFTHKGTFFNLRSSYDFINGTWLLNTKEQPDEKREDFEMYEKPVKAFDDPGNEVKIFIPIL